MIQTLVTLIAVVFLFSGCSDKAVNTNMQNNNAIPEPGIAVEVEPMRINDTAAQYAANEKDEDLDNFYVDYLLEKVPEISKYKENSEQGISDIQFYVNEETESEFVKSTNYESEYRIINVGIEANGKISIWNTFAVEYELEDILVKDKKTNKYIELDEWNSKK